MKKRRIQLGDPFDLSVTKADICCGARVSEGWCPIALAFRRKFRNAEVRVTSKDTSINRRSRCVIYKNPLAARCFIARFDNGLLVEPCVIRFKV